MTFEAGEILTDTVLNALATPSAGSGSVTGGTSFTVSSFSPFLTAGGCYAAQVILTYSGSTLTPSSTGFISGAPVICTLPVAPPCVMYVVCQTNATWGQLIVNTTGTVQLRALQSGGTLASGGSVLFSVCFPSDGT